MSLLKKDKGGWVRVRVNTGNERQVRAHGLDRGDIDTREGGGGGVTEKEGMRERKRERDSQTETER